jgi:hypothetical protein
MFLGVAPPGRKMWTNRRSPVFFGRIVERAEGGSELRFGVYRQGFRFQAFEDAPAQAFFDEWLHGLASELRARWRIRSLETARTGDNVDAMADDLTDFERALLDAVSIGGSRFGVDTDSIDEELLETSPGRAAVEEALRSLVARGLMRSERSWGSLTLRPRDGIHPLAEAENRETLHREYEGDWWIITEGGWAALGVPPPTITESWINPSSGPWRVSPLIAPLCGWRYRRGKPPVPAWYERLTGRPRASR